MNNPSRKPKKSLGFRIAALLSTWIFCFLIYLALVWSTAAEELILGAIASFLVALFASRFLIRENPAYFLSVKRLACLFVYFFFVLPVELVRANWDMARRAFSRKLPDNTGIVRVPTNLVSDYGLLMIANAITLTPGTITMQISEDEEGKNHLYIHWIDVTEESGAPAGDAIKGRLEHGSGGSGNDGIYHCGRVLRRAGGRSAFSPVQRPHGGGPRDGDRHDRPSCDDRARFVRNVLRARHLS